VFHLTVMVNILYDLDGIFTYNHFLKIGLNMSLLLYIKRKGHNKNGLVYRDTGNILIIIM